MMRIILAGIVLATSSFAIAANTAILPQGTWTESCRRMTNEAGKPTGVGVFLSLKSTYAAVGTKQLVWTVTSFKDKACKTFNDANRYTSECAASDNKALGKFLCTQTKLEESSLEGKWTDMPMVDHAGAANIQKSYVSVRTLKKGKIQFTSVDAESEEGEPAILSRVAE